MHELLAQIAAAVIGGTIILILAVIAWRGQRATIEAAQYEAATQGTVDIARALEFDLSNLGAGLAGGRLRTSGAVVAFDTAATTRTLAFWTQTDTAQATAGDSVQVKYEWTATGSAVVRQPDNTFADVPTYAAKRYVNDGTGYTLDGQSGDILTLVAFDFRDSLGASVMPLSTPTVREVEVRIRTVSPLGDIDTLSVAGGAPFIDQSRWHRVFRPVNLTRR